ncbi:MAG: selenocysteine-specific elongation factor [Acidobacteriota bacterium]|jgi:selenocysteine-specific elongation factor|nr:selenocysteine-specific elongation factor [Acidobacteriota bacterium]
MKSIIVGTAGHIDHGKTALVRALTGVDADRLPEEKRRGITIDLGFAELDLDDVRIGFIDVPGHERFVKNMLAGAHGIDLVALVIAADEGVMPQTREHFDICRLLGVQQGLVIITKTDTVDEELLALVNAEAEELVKASFLEGAPILSVSARTGFALEELKSALREVALKVPARSSEMVARLPIDRAFTMRGFGAVVTGTLVAGHIAEGDEMELLPVGARVRARGLQVHGSQVARASAGQRTAVNLGGIEAAQVMRGMVLAPVGRLRPTQIIDARLDVLRSAPRPLRSRMRVRVHLGAMEVLARVRVLEEAGEIAPGKSGFAQLRLESPVVALPHERFIIRSYSPSQTIAGGRILDAFAAKHRGRETARALDRLARLLAADRSGEFALFVEIADEQGLRRAEMAARTGWTDEALADAAKMARESGKVVDADGVYLSRSSFEGMSQAALAETSAHHKREPLARGLLRETLRERIFSHAAPEVFRSVMTHLEKTGALVSEKEFVRAASHKLSLSEADLMLRDKLESIYKDARLEPPTLDEALERARSAGMAREHERKIFQLLLDSRLLLRVAPDLFFHHEALDSLVAKLREYGAEHEPARLIDVATFKEIAGITRKYAIPLLEYFDRERITRRAGDKRIIL